MKVKNKWKSLNVLKFEEMWLLNEGDQPAIIFISLSPMAYNRCGNKGAPLTYRKDTSV